MGSKMARVRVPESDCVAFERRWGVTLPESVRHYILEVGVGGWKGLSPLEDWCQPQEPDEMPPAFLATPFPHTSAWNDRSLATGGWGSPYYSSDLWTGAMRIVNDGCELYYLLVVTGSERGNVWYDGRMDSKGIFPLEGKNGRVAFDEFVTPWHAKLLRLGPR